jgi:acid phosphatase (class A)
MKSILGAVALVLAMPAFAQAAPAAEPGFAYLDARQFNPDQILPAPVAKGSAAEKNELAYLHQIINGASKERMAQATWDDGHEDSALFNAALGIDLKSLPATWALLSIVQDEAAKAATLSKLHFARIRPWGIDPTVPRCDSEPDAKPVKSYPSGHATLGYSVGWVLAHLMPAKASVIMNRAADYATSREVCGAHFPSDTEASHVIGTLVGTSLLADPRLAGRIAAARAELNKP